MTTKLSTKKQNIVVKNKDEETVIPKYKQKTMLDHFIILLGVITAIFFFTAIFDIFYDFSIFCLIGDKICGTHRFDIAIHFIHGDFDLVTIDWFDWLGMGTTVLNPNEGTITFPDGTVEQFEAIYGDSLSFGWSWLPCMIFSVFEVICMVGLVWVIAYYVRDYIEVFKGLFSAIRNIRSDVTGSVKDAFSDLEKSDLIFKKKDGTTSKTKEEKKPTKKKKPEVSEVEVNQDELDKLLTAPDVEVVSGSEKRNSLFSDDE